MHINVILLADASLLN